MRWTNQGPSPDVEDRRGMPAGRGFRMPMSIGGRGMGIGGVVVMLVLSAVFGQDFLSLLGGGDTSGVVEAPPGPTRADPMVNFISFVVDDAQKMWDAELPQQTRHPYRHAKLVLFTDAVRSGCGFAEAAMGPFYCPLDGKVYIDLGFYRDLKQRFGAPGDFAQAYVIAHELGHHVQNLLGISDDVRRRQRERPDQAKALSVRLELQADCLAGVWGHSTSRREILEQGDLEEALNAAAAIGDDRIQRNSGRNVNPETWTHGSAKQRAESFRRGFTRGKLAECETP